MGLGNSNLLSSTAEEVAKEVEQAAQNKKPERVSLNPKQAWLLQAQGALVGEEPEKVLEELKAEEAAAADPVSQEPVIRNAAFIKEAQDFLVQQSIEANEERLRGEHDKEIELGVNPLVMATEAITSNQATAQSAV